MKTKLINLACGLVLPNEPYNALRFYTKGGTAEVTDFSIYKLTL